MIVNAEEQAKKEIIELANEMMADWSSSRNKQKNFVIEYIKENFSNATDAARKAGYADNYVNRQANHLLNVEHIKEVLIAVQEAYDERAMELSIASSIEIKQYLTRIMRGQEQEQTLMGIGQGSQKITDIDVATSERIKAAELLGKSQKLWTDRMEHINNVPVIISGEDELED